MRQVYKKKYVYISIKTALKEKYELLPPRKPGSRGSATFMILYLPNVR